MCPDIGFNKKILDTEVNNNVLIKLEERQNVKRCKYDDLSFLSVSESTSNKGGRMSGSRNKSKCERLTEIIMNCGSPNNQLDVLRQVMKRPFLSTTLEIISSRSSESSNNITQP